MILLQKLQNLGEFVDFAQNSRNRKLFKKRKSLKKRAGTVGQYSSFTTTDIDENEVNQRKFSNIINKKFSELMGRKTSQSPSAVSIPSNQSQPSIYSDGGMNLDHVNAVDAQSISSGNHSQSDNDGNNDENININLHKNLSIQRDKSDNNHGNRTSVSNDNSAPSEVMTDLP